MSYLLFIVEPVGQRAQRTPQEGREAYAQMVRYAEDLSSRGLLVRAESLKSESESVRLRIRDGERSLVDGPYAEAKEMIGGFFLLNCDTREEALALAAECPAAQWATVEVRETWPLLHVGKDPGRRTSGPRFNNFPFLALTGGQKPPRPPPSCGSTTTEPLGV